MFFRILAQITYTILIILETLVSIRFILILINVKPIAKIVIWLYGATDVVLSPFIGIFQNDPVKLLGFTVELTSLLVVFVLTLCSYALYEIIKAFSQ